MTRHASRREAVLISEGICPLCDEVGELGELDAIGLAVAICQRCEAEFTRVGDWPEEDA